MLWPMAITDYLRRTGGVPAAGWRRANSWWTHIYWESTLFLQTAPNTTAPDWPASGDRLSLSWLQPLNTKTSPPTAGVLQTRPGRGGFRICWPASRKQSRVENKSRAHSQLRSQFPPRMIPR
jgi:hypothetical protein